MADLRVLLLLGVAVSGAAVVMSHRRDIRAARERIENPERRAVRTDYGSVEYARVGGGYLVLAVHGNAGGFDPGLQVIAPLRFGYLGSPMPSRASVAMQADAYACLLDALAFFMWASCTSRPVYPISRGAGTRIRGIR